MSKVYSAIINCIENDEIVFQDNEYNRSIAIALFEHFCEMHGFEKFMNTTINLPTYEQYYQEAYKKHFIYDNNVREKILEGEKNNDT